MKVLKFMKKGESIEADWSAGTKGIICQILISLRKDACIQGISSSDDRLCTW